MGDFYVNIGSVELYHKIIRYTFLPAYVAYPHIPLDFLTKLC